MILSRISIVTIILLIVLSGCVLTVEINGTPIPFGETPTQEIATWTPAPTPLPTVRVTGLRVNVRSCDNVSTCSVIDTVIQGETYSYDRITPNGWYHIQLSPNQWGYIAGWLVVDN